MFEHRDTYGQAQVCGKGHQRSSVDRPCQPSFCWIMHKIRYLRVFDYVSMSKCAAGPARESRVYPLETASDGKKQNAPSTPIQPLPGDSAPLRVIDTAANRGRNNSHSRGGGGQVRKDTSPIQKKSSKKALFVLFVRGKGFFFPFFLSFLAFEEPTKLMD